MMVTSSRSSASTPWRTSAMVEQSVEAMRGSPSGAAVAVVTSLGTSDTGTVVHGLEGGLMGRGLLGEPGDERLHLRQSSLGLGMDDVIGEVDGGGDLKRRHQAAGVEVGLRQGAFGQGDAASVGGGLDDHARLVETRAPGAVDGLDAARGQPHRPVRAGVVGVGRAVMQQYMVGKVAGVV